MLPSGPGVMSAGPLLAGRGESVLGPPAPLRPVLTRARSVGRGNSSICPAGLILAIRPEVNSVNQMWPSGPVVIPAGWLFFVRRAKWVAAPPPPQAVATRAMVATTATNTVPLIRVLM